MREGIAKSVGQLLPKVMQKLKPALSRQAPRRVIEVDVEVDVARGQTRADKGRR